MKRYIKLICSVLFSTLLVASLNANTVLAQTLTDEELEIQEFEVSYGQLLDGVTVVLTRNEDGSFTQSVFYGNIDSETTDSLSGIEHMRATADGVLEWAVFHLGFNDWNGDTGRLYFTVSADEAMYRVSGSAYVKSTSFLFPTTYYSDSFNKLLYGSFNTSRTLEDDVDTGDEDSVRVGFTGVSLITVGDETGYFVDSSQVVSR